MSDTIGMLAPTPTEILTRFRLLTETNVSAPPALDTGFPIQPVIDTSRFVTEIVLLAGYSSTAANSITMRWNTVTNPELFAKIRAARHIRFQSVTYGYGGTGTGVQDAGCFLKYGNDTNATYLNAGQAEVPTVVAGPTSNANVELMPFPKEFPTTQLLSWGDGNNQFSGEERCFLEEILFIVVNVSGFNAFANPCIAMELLY